VEVREVVPVTPRLTRVTLQGPELEGFVVDRPAASVRLLLPGPGAGEPVVPAWNGNEFLLPDGSRPPIRTFTPLRADPDAHSVDIEVVVHAGGRASEWVLSGPAGTVVALSGPGRGYEVDDHAPAFLLAGDETALPAITQLLEQLPVSVEVRVHVEIADPRARLPLEPGPPASIIWHDLPEGAAPGDALVAAVSSEPVAPETRVWVAGEAAAVQRIRRDLFAGRGLSRRFATVRGYWKYGRAGDGEPD
jgi:NADPH-dependent ferric siderophore reductase